jgi:hypothetical protein
MSWWAVLAPAWLQLGYGGLRLVLRLKRLPKSHEAEVRRGTAVYFHA